MALIHDSQLRFAPDAVKKPAYIHVRSDIQEDKYRGVTGKVIEDRKCYIQYIRVRI